LKLAGVYDLGPTDGPTGYFGSRLNEALMGFQKDHGLRVDGAVTSDGETIRALGQTLQDMGRRGDTVLAHLTRQEAAFLDRITDGGSINPQTRLLEFYPGGGWGRTASDSDLEPFGGPGPDVSSARNKPSEGRENDPRDYPPAFSRAGRATLDNRLSQSPPDRPRQIKQEKEDRPRQTTAPAQAPRPETDIEKIRVRLARYREKEAATTARDEQAHAHQTRLAEQARTARSHEQQAKMKDLGKDRYAAGIDNTETLRRTHPSIPQQIANIKNRKQKREKLEALREKKQAIAAATQDGVNKPKSPFKEFRENLRPREGGFVDDPKDYAGPTNQGIYMKFLDLYTKKHPQKGLPNDPKELTDSQITNLFREEFYDRPKIGKLVNVPDLRKNAPKLTEQIFDSGILHGPTVTGQWLQKSLDEKLGTDLRVPDKNGAMIYDGDIGPDTRSTIELAIKSGKIAGVNNAIVIKRLELMKRQPEYNTYRNGWKNRAGYFLIPR